MRKTVLGAGCLVLGALALCGGCRREDVRTFTTPCSLTEAQAKKALARYQGVRQDSIRVANGQAEVTFDSMQIAEENIRRELGQ